LNNIKYLFLAFTLSLLTAQNKSVIAVADISSDGLSSFEIKQVFNRLESDLVNLGQYNVTSRSEVDKILKEQKFQKSGCTDQECAADIGRMLNADFMLLSNILYDTRSGDINVTLKLVDVETARITTSISRDETVTRVRDINNFLYDYLVELYRKDSGEQPRDIYQTQKDVVGFGTLIIESSPIGATVLLDNAQKGVTPLIVESIEAGQHSIIMSYTGYERLTKAIMITADDTTTVSELLIMRTGHLQIVSNPVGADVHINEEYKGKTPLTLEYMNIGDYFLKIEYEGYEENVSKVTVEWNKTIPINRPLTAKPASVMFYSVPDGASVYVDKKNVGKTTVEGLVVYIPHGVHDVTMKLKRYSSATETLTLTPNQNTSLELQLSKLPEGVSEDPNAGWVNLNGWPEDSKVTLKRNILKLPLRYYELKKGKYSFTISKDGYLNEKVPFTIYPQKLTDKTFKLSPVDRKTAFKKAFTFPGLGHFYAEKPLDGVKWLGLELAGLYATFYMLDVFISKNADYKNAHDEYLAANDHEDIKHKKAAYQDAFDQKNLSLYGLTAVGCTAAIVWGWNVYDLHKSLPIVRKFSKDAKLKIGVNKKGQLETQVEF